MNPNALRGLAALALLCLIVPRLSALVVTTTTLHAFGGSQFGHGPAGGGASIRLSAPDHSLGTFVGVSVTAVVNAVGIGVEYNPYMPTLGGPPLYVSPFPNGMPATPQILATTYFRSKSEPPVSERRVQTKFEPPVTLAYNESVSLRFSYQETFSAFLDPTAFRVTPIDFNAATVVMGFGAYGNTYLAGNVTFTTAYEYRVREAGSTFVLLAAGLILVGVAARRFAFV